MISNADPNLLASMFSALSPSTASDGLGFSFPGKRADIAAPALGVSTSAAPLISAPSARQSTEFQAAIAPPTQPKNPSIAPPKSGRDANVMGGSSAVATSPTAKLGYFAGSKLQLGGSQSNGLAGNRNEFMAALGRGAIF